MAFTETNLLCKGMWAPFATSVTTATVSAILCVITVPGNLLICWAVIRNPTGNLRTSFNYLVLNLAIADLIIGAVTEPLFVYYLVNEALQNPVLWFQWIPHISYFLTSTASVTSIVALAVNRYQVVTSKRMHKSKLSSVAVTSALVWIFSLGLPFLYFVVGFYMLAFIFVNASLAIASVVLIFVYYRVYCSFKRHNRSLRHIRSSRREQEKKSKRDERTTNSLILIIVSFVVCVIPSWAMVYVLNFCQACDCVLIHWLRDLQFVFFLINGALNQFLYAWRMRSFQQVFKTIPAIHWLTKTFFPQRKNRASSVTSQTDSTPL